jgi:transposase
VGCLRRIGVLTGLGLADEVGDWHRCTGAYLDLVPAEHSNGSQRIQGSISKTGNTHARRLHIRERRLDARGKRPPSAWSRWLASCRMVLEPGALET